MKQCITPYCFGNMDFALGYSLNNKLQLSILNCKKFTEEEQKYVAIGHGAYPAVEQFLSSKNPKTIDDAFKILDYAMDISFEINEKIKGPPLDGRTSVFVDKNGNTYNYVNWID